MQVVKRACMPDRTRCYSITDYCATRTSEPLLGMVQARLSAGYLSLANALHEEGFLRSFIAPVGLAYQQIYTTSGAQETSATDAWEQWDPESHGWRTAEAPMYSAAFGAESPVTPVHLRFADYSPPLEVNTKADAPASSLPTGTRHSHALPGFESPTAALSLPVAKAEEEALLMHGPEDGTTQYNGQKKRPRDIEEVLSGVQVGMSFVEIAEVAPWLGAQVDSMGNNKTATSATTALKPVAQSSAVSNVGAVPFTNASDLEFSDNWRMSNVTLDTCGDHQKGDSGVEGLDGTDGRRKDLNTFNYLYKSDGKHPSSLGSYLAACTIASAITGTAASWAVASVWPSIRLLFSLASGSDLMSYLVV